MSRLYIVLFFFPLIFCGAIAAEPAAMPVSAGISFVENRGQVVDIDGKLRPDILYTTETAGVKVYCTKLGLSYVFSRTDETTPARAMQQSTTDGHHLFPDAEESVNRKTTLYRMDVEFVGAVVSDVVAEETTQEYFNYYYAHCPNGITNVHSHKKLVYRNLYPNIDFVLYARDGGLKYDFIVHPGGDPSKIRLRYHGAEDMTHLKNGTLHIKTPLGEIEEKKPYTYQGAEEIASRYVLKGTEVGFAVGRYNHAATLVIDPDLLWSTYCGGAQWEMANDVATDGDRNVIITGITMGNDFPTRNAFQTTLIGASDVFITKFTSSGQCLWSTYYGGADRETGVSIDVNTAGRIVVAGETASADFPVESALQSTFGGVKDAFVLTLLPNGQRARATFLGGSDTESAHGIAIGSDGTVVVMGKTKSINFPVLNAFQPLYAGGWDTFVTKINPLGQLAWSTYLGGSGSDGSLNGGTTDALAMDAAGNIIVGGATTSNNFPVLLAFQSMLSGTTDAFITKFTSTGNVVWSTYYGGSLTDGVDGVATDLSGNILICGFTTSTDFPIQNAFQSTNHGNDEGCILKFTSQGERLWATYCGGSNHDGLWSIATDNSGNVYIAGYTQSNNFPVLNPLQPLLSGMRDAFILRLDGNGRKSWGTFFGGSNLDNVIGVTIDDFGSIVIAGMSYSSDLPLLHPFQNSQAGSLDAFVAKFGCEIPDPELLSSGIPDLCEGDSLTLSTSIQYERYLWSNGATTASITVGESGVYQVTVYKGLDCMAVSDPVTVTVFPRPVPDIDGSSFLCPGSAVTLRTTKPFRSYRWASAAATEILSTNATLTVSEPGLYTVTVTDENGCAGTSATLQVIGLPAPVTQIALTPPNTSMLCPGDSVVLTALGSFPSYRWSNGASTASITVRSAGLFTVSVVDDNGCTSQTVSQKIELVNIPTDVISGPLSLCINGEATYQVQARAGVSYVWTVTGGTVLTDVTTNSIRVRWSQPGTGTVMLTRSIGQCSVTSGPLDVLVADKLQPVMTGPLELCNGDDIELGVAGIYSTYTWSTGKTSPTLTVDMPGTYSVTVTNDDGCSGTTTVTVSAGTPAASILGPTSVCFNSIAGYSADNTDVTFSFVWSVTGGVILSGETTSTVSVEWGSETTGTLTLTVRRADSDCISETTQTVTIEDVLRPAISASSLFVCAGGEVVLSADAGYRTYLWSTGATTADITVNTEGEYSVSVTDNNGCTGSTSVSISRRDVQFGQAEQLEWINVTSGTVTDGTVVWTNEGTETVRVESVSFTTGVPEFSATFSPPLPADIPPGGTLTITIQFQPKQSGTYKDNAVIAISSPCSVERTINVSGTSAQSLISMTARMPDTTAFPWMREYAIPLYVRLISPKTVEAQSVEFELAMDATVFFPRSLSRGVITGNAVDGATGERILRGRIDNVTLTQQETILTTIVGDVLLGEKDNTVLLLRTLALADGTRGNTENGLLQLEGICREGGARFVRSKDGFGITIQPQPVQETLTALVEVVEVGECSLELYSADGRSEVLQQWRHSSGSDGATIMSYDVSGKGSGVYWLVLRTPTQTSTAQFLIVK